MEQQAYIGRQPIMDAKQSIIGYELLFRHDSTAESAEFEDDLKACTNVLTNTIGDMDIEWLLGNRLAFINVSDKALQSEFLDLMPPKQTVFEILRSVEPTEALLKRCKMLVADGYHFALDNPHLNDYSDQFLPYASYVKIDMLNTSDQQAELLYAKYHSPKIKLVAEKVETFEKFNACQKIGYKYFQGFYFAKPQTFTKKVVNASFDSVLNILNTVTRDGELSEIEAGFKRDAALSFKLLRYINSVGFGLSCEIQSISHALSILGRKQLHRWLTLLMVTAGENATSPALMKTSLTRGRLTELLGESYFEQQDKENLFIVGVFSLLDVILKSPMPDILEKIQLPETVTDALLNRQGIYGPFLELTEACEQDDTEKIKELAGLLQFDAKKVNESHIAALAWVEDMQEAL